MGFSRKRKIAHIFKIMNGIDFTDGQDILQMCAFVTHALSLLSQKRADYAKKTSYLKLL